jgi:hypothetical protein
MAIDVAQAIFAQREYAYSEDEDTSVKTEQPLARTIEITTNNSNTACDVLASEILADNKEVGKLLEVQIQGLTVCAPAQLDGSPPVFNVKLTGFTPDAGMDMRVVSANINPNECWTKVLLKGQY